MKTNITILTAIALLVTFSLNAQVAINTDGSSPDASTMLDIQSTDRGTSFPNLNIADMSTAAPVTSPKTGLIAYNTNTSTGPGLVMWDGSEWVIFELEGRNWSLLGNAGTAVATNFLGTTDYNSLAFGTDDIERMRVRRDGEVVVNSTSYYPGVAFTSFATGTNTAIIGNSTSGMSVYGTSGSSSSSVRAINTNSVGTGLTASGNNEGGYFLPTGTGVAATGADGVFGFGTDSDGTGIIGLGSNGSTSYSTNDGSGGAFTGYHGSFNKGRDLNEGIGVIGVGNDSSHYHFISGGSGGVFSGAQVGAYAYATKTSDGTGIVGVGNRNSTYKLYTNGSGGAFTGERVGVYGYATKTGGNNGNPENRVGGYFEDNNTYARVGGTWNNTSYGILSNGALTGAKKSSDGKSVLMFCPETPEVLYEDFGVGELVNGMAYISIDQILTENIQVDEIHPLKVFIQLEGECNGVYVTNKSATGFDVIELQGGSSNVTFSWQIVATRASEVYRQKDGTVETSDFSKRFPPGPGPLETKIVKDASSVQKTVNQKADEEKLAEKETILEEKTEK